jgi:hypothetical protein
VCFDLPTTFIWRISHFKNNSARYHKRKNFRFKNVKCKMSKSVHLEPSRSMRKNGRTDGYNEATSRFFPIFRKRLKRNTVSGPKKITQNSPQIWVTHNSLFRYVTATCPPTSFLWNAAPAIIIWYLQYSSWLINAGPFELNVSSSHTRMSKLRMPIKSRISTPTWLTNISTAKG